MADPLCGKPIPAEQAHIVGPLVERNEFSSTEADVRPRLEWLADLLCGLAGIGNEAA